MVLIGYLLSFLALQAVAPERCVAVQAAHEALLGSSFTVERHLTVNMNGELKVREVSRLEYADRELVIKQLEFEQFDKNVVIEPSESDAALEASLVCDLVEDLGGDRYRVSTKDGKEELEFILDADRKALIPVVWRNHEKKRFLWKKFIIKADLIYKNFEWQD